MFKSTWSALCVAVAFVLVMTAGSFAQTKGPSEFYKNEATMLTKMAIQQEKSKRLCTTIVSARIDACRAFYTKLVANVLERLSALDEWQGAVKVGNRPKTWEGKIRYNELMAQWKELVRRSWLVDYFPTSKWSVSENAPNKALGFAFEPDLKLAIENSLACKVLPGERGATCAKDFDEYIAALREVISSAELVEKAKAANDREKYFDAYVVEGRAVAKMTVIESRVYQAYVQ